MANVIPPATLSGTPKLRRLRPGLTLFRISPYAFAPDAFKPLPSHRYYGGGRFDSTDDDRYGFMYAGTSMSVAIAERLLRDSGPDATSQVLPRAMLDGLHAFSLTLGRELTLVDLTGREGQSSVAQTPWLTGCEPRDYAQTRHWGHWIRKQSPDAAGYIWTSRQENHGDAVVLFQDRIKDHAATLVPADPASFVKLDDDAGRRWLRQRLLRFNATVAA